MDDVRHRLLLLCLTTIALFCLAPILPAQDRCAPRKLSPVALRGDVAASNWLTYRSPKNGLTFRYPESMWVKELDPTSFHLDVVPELVLDIKANESNNPDSTILRFICARGRETPEMASSDARALLKTRPHENPSGRVDEGAIGTMQVDGHEAVVSCSCGRAACHYRVLTLQPYECKILPTVSKGDIRDNLPPPHDGDFPILSIINTVHFEPVTN